MSTELKITEKISLAQSLEFKKDGSIHINCTAIQYIDKDTRQYIVYMPALEISGYGDTRDKAIEMLNFSANEFCMYLHTLKPKQLNAELLKLGWRHNVLSKGNYSKSFVDGDGELQGFNAEDNSLELIRLNNGNQLQAAARLNAGKNCLPKRDMPYTY